MSKAIVLTRGMKTIVDDEDYGLLSESFWHAHDADGRFYAGREVGTRANSKFVYMHRVILKASRGQVVDHISGDTLDNRRVNLRLGTQGQNAANAGKRPGVHTSKYKGVCRDIKHSKKWIAIIGVNYKRITLGRFVDEFDAAQAYNFASEQYFGSFSRYNIPLP